MNKKKVLEYIEKHPEEFKNELRIITTYEKVEDMVRKNDALWFSLKRERELAS